MVISSACSTREPEGPALKPALLKRRADFAAILEALYSPEPDATKWAQEAVAATSDIFTGPLGVSLIAVAHGDDHAGASVLLGVSSSEVIDGVLEWTRKTMGEMPREAFRTLYYPGQPIVTHLELEKRLSAE